MSGDGGCYCPLVPGDGGGASDRWSMCGCEGENTIMASGRRSLQAPIRLEGRVRRVAVHGPVRGEKEPPESLVRLAGVRVSGRMAGSEVAWGQCRSFVCVDRIEIESAVSTYNGTPSHPSPALPQGTNRPHFSGWLVEQLQQKQQLQQKCTFHQKNPLQKKKQLQQFLCSKNRKCKSKIVPCGAQIASISGVFGRTDAQKPISVFNILM